MFDHALMRHLTLKAAKHSPTSSDCLDVNSNDEQTWLEREHRSTGPGRSEAEMLRIELRLRKRSMTTGDRIAEAAQIFSQILFHPRRDGIRHGIKVRIQFRQERTRSLPTSADGYVFYLRHAPDPKAKPVVLLHCPVF
jgi:hypothetical protein